MHIEATRIHPEAKRLSEEDNSLETFCNVHIHLDSRCASETSHLFFLFLEGRRRGRKGNYVYVKRTARQVQYEDSSQSMSLIIRNSPVRSVWLEMEV